MRTTTGALLLALLPSIAVADDWAQFQGPRGDGTSPEKITLRAWGPEGPPVAWKATIKMGWSSPSISKDEVFVAWTEQQTGVAETVACLDAASGAEKWKYTYEVGPYWKRNIGWAPGGFRSTPAVDDRFVVALGAIGHLHCLDRKTGKVLWMKNLWDEWTASGEKGYSGSPLLVDGKLIVYYGDGSHKTGLEKLECFVLCRAFDPATGAELWTFAEPHREGISMGEGQTPAITTIGGRRCALFMGNRCLIALAVADGKLVWRFECSSQHGRGMTIPTPLVLDRMIVNLPDADSLHAVSFDPAKAEAAGAFAWRSGLYWHCALHQFRPRGGYLYGFLGEIQGESAAHASKSVVTLTCVDAATGKAKWSEPGFRNGVAITEADGLLFVRSYQTLRLVEATPNGYRKLGEIKVHDCRLPTVNLVDMVMPVVSGGRLYVRTPDELICYNVAK
ncbi:MAG TPA: PQQ-binding-like beta-propeller repeat protein [Planctomycetota bacterium]|jgi:outer membrane protein assembly factor BamB|nr:PQQ-binding-like beta-propeller repeat protein [Planctomycetota bacterium]